MPSYADYEAFTAVYSVKGVTQTELDSYWLQYGYLRLNEALGACFTVPFSSNNLTAIDLNVQFSMYGILVRTRNLRDSNELWRELQSRLDDFKSGNAPMTLDDGTSLFSSNTLNEPWSTTKDYNPVFDMRPAIDQRVDIDQLQDEYDRDW